MKNTKAKESQEPKKQLTPPIMEVKTAIQRIFDTTGENTSEAADSLIGDETEQLEYPEHLKVRALTLIARDLERDKMNMRRSITQMLFEIQQLKKIA